MLQAVGNNALIGETIVDVKFGHPLKPNAGSYGCYTLVFKSGKEVAISQGWGEINFSQEKEKKRV